MKFKWVHVNTKNRVSTDEVTIECGKVICGLQVRQNRPTSIELTRQELLYLLKTPEYAAVLYSVLSSGER